MRVRFLPIPLRLWESRDWGKVASEGAKNRLSMEGERNPPEGAESKRELLYLSFGIPDIESLPREEINPALRQMWSGRTIRLLETVSGITLIADA
ncbi:MAG: hypothetical protein GY866_14540 [Proteobacteria bacterium]|nr:hypothetical protein [Pseudomonadota bacterium]